jgi:NAD(P)-dependent dehydrogenase (short-subunit alcohol dehydrogenase family)
MYVSHDGAAAEAVKEIQGLGRQALAVKADSSVREEVRRAVAEAESRLGAIDVLVYCAGVQKRVFFLDLEEADWDWMLDTNLKGCFLVGQAVAERMKARGYGKIITSPPSQPPCPPSACPPTAYPRREWRCSPSAWPWSWRNTASG